MSVPPGPWRIAGGVQLRPLAEADAGELYALVEANRAHLARWLSWAAGQDRDGTLAFVRGAVAQAARDDGFVAAVVADGEIAGVAGFHGVDWAKRSTDVGYWLGEEHQGRGTMTAVVRRLVDHALTERGLNRVEIRIATGNRRSRAIPERLGFREEGILRQAELVGGRHLDVAVYSVLAEEWRP